MTNPSKWLARASLRTLAPRHATGTSATLSFLLRLRPETSARVMALTRENSQPFRVSCDEEELFVGVFYILAGAAAIQTPVIHADEDPSGGTITLRLGSVQGAWLFSSGGGGSVAMRERIDRPELRANLCARGILTELEP